MIILCPNCSKKFDIDAKLIPNKGRLLQCSSCNHKWFFKTAVKPELKENIDLKNREFFKPNYKKKNYKELNKTKNINDKKNTPINENIKKITDKVQKKVKKNSILNLIIVFLISFIAFIIIIDTFKTPISKIIPNIEFILYNLYESIKDIILFIRDLT
jgi:predicted Zn finger-like uncharacterized protein